MALAFVIWRFSDTMLEHTGWLFVKTKRFARFAALVFVSMVSASLYTVVLSQWIRLRRAWPNDWSRWNSDDEWTGLLHASVLWEGQGLLPKLPAPCTDDGTSHNTDIVLLDIRSSGRNL